MILNNNEYKKLEKLVKYACEKVPYYKNRFGDKRDILFKDMPVINKDVIRENFNELISDEADLAECDIEYTSGSSGLPLKCLKSKKEIWISQRKIWKWRSEWFPGIMKKRLLTFSN